MTKSTTKSNKCIYCLKPIMLIPSAKERADKYGGSPKDYQRIFIAHPECQILKWYGR